MQFASRETLRDMTKRRQKGAIARHLSRVGVRYTLDAEGWPKVPQASLERLYGVSGRIPASHGVDVDALAAIGLG